MRRISHRDGGCAQTCHSEHDDRGYRADVIGAAITENEEAARAAGDRFLALAKSQGVPARIADLTETLANAVARFAKIARTFDFQFCCRDADNDVGEQEMYSGDRRASTSRSFTDWQPGSDGAQED
ncbi:MAG TPA: hypothetical protein VJQ55_10015 [Candidatus Binatia bacterium]|nr:hypothetical protein [Candidatus Binatia bacterium]